MSCSLRKKFSKGEHFTFHRKRLIQNLQHSSMNLIETIAFPGWNGKNYSSKPHCPASPWSRERSETYLQDDCKQPEMVFETLISSLNLTSIYLSSIDLVRQHQSGGIIPNYALLSNVSENPEALAFIEEQGNTLLYCEEVRSETTSVLLWFSPFDNFTWMTILLTCLLTILISSVSLGKENRRLILTLLDRILRILLKQSFRFHSNSASLAVLSLGILVTHAFYEILHTTSQVQLSFLPKFNLSRT